MVWLLLLCALAGGASAALTPRVYEPRLPAADVVIASLAVAPNADSAAIQAAIDEAAAAGGAVVFLPAGRYRLDRPLTVKEGVTLRGEWLPPTARRVGEGTVLAITTGRGSAAGPAAVTVERGSGLRDLALWYPEQSATAPVPYPWCVAFSESQKGDNCTLLNVTLVNPWRGFKVGPAWNELHTLRNVYGTPLKLGLFCDTCTDIGRLTNVDFDPRWWAESGLPGAPDAAVLADYLKREATGAEIGRSDWEYVYQLRVRGYAVGLRFLAGVQGTTNAVMYGCELTECGTALALDALNAVGLAVTGGRLDGDTAVACPASFTAIAQFNACALSGLATAVRLDGRGTLTLQNCRLAGGLNAGQGTVTALDCEWSRPGEAVVLGEQVRRARLLGCRFAGEPGIVNRSHGDIGIAHTPLGTARADVSPHLEAPEPRPATARLVDVTATGAATTADDNTAAFQAALDQAGQAGGGTVYVPAGRWKLRGGLTVPTGVELRGIWDVPHHTQSAGSVLLLYAGQDAEDGPPALSLRPGSGVRGLTCWYPEQDVRQPKPYPWTVRGFGPRCWVVDVTLGNSWQGIDFASAPSDGHVVRYLAGGPLKRGLRVGRCGGDGWVEDVQFNPHYVFRVPGTLTHPPFPNGDRHFDWLRANLEGLVFTDCAREHVRGTFLYAAYDGLRCDGTSGRVVIHGSDTVARPAFVDRAGASGLEVHLAQLVPWTDRSAGALATGTAFSGRAVFYNTQVWGQPRATVEAHGDGELVVQQLHTRSGGCHGASGRLSLVNVHLGPELAVPITLDAGCQAPVVLAATHDSSRSLNVASAAPDAYVRGCAAAANTALAGPATALPRDRFQWTADWTKAPRNLVTAVGGGRKDVGELVSEPTPTGWRLAGVPGKPDYAFVYCTLATGPFGVAQDSVLRYRLKPLNEQGRACCVDLVFSDGSTLRDSAQTTTAGLPARGAGGNARVGEWTEVVLPLGQQCAGKVIATVMVAYDSRRTGPFEALFDGLTLTSGHGLDAAAVKFTPAPGAVARGTAIACDAGAAVRYTLDGRDPGPDSPLWTAPVVLARVGLAELRWRRATGGPVGSLLYDVR